MADLKPVVDLSRRAVLDALAKQVERIQARHSRGEQRCAAGWPALDEALGGGLSLGAVHEVIAGGPGAPVRSFLLRLAAAVIRPHPASARAADRILPVPGVECRLNDPPPAGSSVIPTAGGPASLPLTTGLGFACDTTGGRAAVMPVAQVERVPGRDRSDRWWMIVDAAGDFYPPAVAARGVPLERLLIVRARGPRETLWVCEQALRCPAIGVLIAPLPRAAAQATRRLQLAAEAGGGLGLLWSAALPRAATFAASRIRVDALPGGQESPRARVTVLKARRGRPPAPFELVLADGSRGESPAASPPPRWSEAG